MVVFFLFQFSNLVFVCRVAVSNSRDVLIRNAMFGAVLCVFLFKFALVVVLKPWLSVDCV